MAKAPTLFEELMQMRMLMKNEWEKGYRGFQWHEFCSDARKGFTQAHKQKILDIMNITSTVQNNYEVFRFCAMNDEIWELLIKARQIFVDRQKQDFMSIQINQLKKVAKAKRKQENVRRVKHSDEPLPELDEEALEDALANEVDVK